MTETSIRQPVLKAPFPWFGGKSRVARIVWDRFGNVPNYVEPFFGSGAVLLGRPHDARTETVNDLDCFVANFWRALQHDPEAVAAHADYPVNEADLQARHLWLVNSSEFRERMKNEPDYFDAKIAGWWVWGQSAWIGSGWCAGTSSWSGEPFSDGRLLHVRLPSLGDAGRGVNRAGSLIEYMTALSTRLRRVRMACGDWSRVTGPSVTFRHGLTGVFLDPPYSDEAERHKEIHAYILDETCGGAR
jgi:site-specific DNA-adenine methylase